MAKITLYGVFGCVFVWNANQVFPFLNCITKLVNLTHCYCSVVTTSIASVIHVLLYTSTLVISYASIPQDKLPVFQNVPFKYDKFNLSKK